MSDNKRPETGPMQFGDDWPGVFIRGDNAMWNGQQLKWLLEMLSDECKSRVGALMLMQIESFASTLSSCLGDKPAGSQVLKKFDDCVCEKHQEHLDEIAGVSALSDDDLTELFTIRKSLHSASLQKKIADEIVKRGLDLLGE